MQSHTHKWTETILSMKMSKWTPDILFFSYPLFSPSTPSLLAQYTVTPSSHTFPISCSHYILIISIDLQDFFLLSLPSISSHSFFLPHSFLIVLCCRLCLHPPPFLRLRVHVCVYNNHRGVFLSYKSNSFPVQLHQPQHTILVITNIPYRSSLFLGHFYPDIFSPTFCLGAD